MSQVYHNTVAESENAFLQQFREAADKTNKWLGVVFSVENGRVIMRRTTSEFPDGDWRTALELLSKEMVNNAMKAPVESLPMARRFLPSGSDASPPVADAAIQSVDGGAEEAADV